MKHFYNLCSLITVIIKFHFDFKHLSVRNLFRLVLHFYCLESDLSAHFSMVRTAQFYCVSPDPYSTGSGYKTKLGHTGKVKLQFIVSAFLKRHVGEMSLFIISFGPVQVLKQ